MWVRVDANMPHHPKVLKLARCLGDPAALLYVIRLWLWASQFAKDGSLAAHDAVDVAIGCGWNGDPEVLLDALLACKLLDKEKSSVVIHDWEEHQGKHLKAAEADRARARKNRELQRSRTVRERSPDVRGNVTIRNVRNEEKKDSCTEPDKPDSVPPPVLVVPTNGKPAEWGLSPDKLAEWKASYPSVDVLAEIRKARQWVLDNPSRRKTARGMPAFLNRWLSKANDSGTFARRDAPPPAPGRTMQIIRAPEGWEFGK